MAEYWVYIDIGATVTAKVEAGSANEALEKGHGQLIPMSLCHHCDQRIELFDPIATVVMQDGKKVLERPSYWQQRVQDLKAEIDALHAELRKAKSAAPG